MMLTPEIDAADLERLEARLVEIEKREAKLSIAPSVREAESTLSIRQALMSPSREIAVEDALGEVLASANVSCPPAIPILVCGEVIDRNAIECFKYYGIEKCRVIKR